MLDILRLVVGTFEEAIDIVFQYLAGKYFQQAHDSSLKSQTMKNIVILGGSYAGISTAHRILKQAAKSGPFKITLVSPNTHFYWNMASARGLIPGQLTDEKLFQAIAPGFDHYPASKFEFILASAESLDVDAKVVEISGSPGNNTLPYDILILATGSHTRGNTPFKGLGSTKETKNALHDIQSQVKKAHTIVIAGAGVTGVETAGELGFEYGREKEVILIASGETVLAESPASVSKTAMKDLQNLKVDIRLQTKVTSSAQMPNGQHELMLSGGDKLVTDLYIPTFGLIRNSSYVPENFLNANGSVIVDDYLKMRGTKDVWAIGDVSDVEHSQFISCDRQSAYVAKSITLILRNKPPLPYKAITRRFMGLQIGKNAGTGHFGSIKIPSFIIIRARKTLFIENMGPTVDGSLF